MKKPSPAAIAYYLMVAVIIGSIVYTKIDTRSQVDRSEQRQADRNTVQLACLSRTFEDFLAGNQELRDANARWRTALVGSKRAESRLNQLRYIDQRPVGDPGITQAAQQYIAQTQAFIDASEDYDKALLKYKLPDFQKRCGRVAPRIKDVFYREVNEPPWQPQAIGASLE